MNATIATADRTTHLKVVIVGLSLAIAATLLAIITLQ
jgi:hypothetical protein